MDPDNRRPVDFEQRQQLLASPLSEDQLLQQWRSGAIKQALIARTLHLRARHPQLFSRGSYIPLTVSGPRATQVLAFARRWQDQLAVIVVPRLSAADLQKQAPVFSSKSIWADTCIDLPFDGLNLKLKGLFETPVVTKSKTLRVCDALDTFPVNLMINP